jgi:hypothetical protein
LACFLRENKEKAILRGIIHCMGNPNFILPLALGHMPQRVHDQEKLYSPPLRSIAGGYSYTPTMNMQSEEAREYNAKYDKRYPNPDFLLDMQETPENAPENAKEQERQRQRDKENVRNCVRDGNIVKCKLPDGRWITTDGRIVPPPTGF